MLELKNQNKKKKMNMMKNLNKKEKFSEEEIKNLWKKEAYELIDYDSEKLTINIIQTQNDGYLYRNNNIVEFSKDPDKEDREKLLKIIRTDNNFHLRLNDYSFGEDENISTTNSAWFLLRKSLLDDRMNEYNLKEGDIIRIGRITLKIKKIKFNNNRDNISTNTNLQEVKQAVKKNKPKDEETKTKTCRICYSEEEYDGNPLIQPCTCSGSMELIHLECLKHWLKTSIYVKLDSSKECCIYLRKTPECELCKTKYPDFFRHKGKMYEIFDFQDDFENYLAVESLTMDKNQNRYMYIISLNNPDSTITVGRGHDCILLLSDISVSRWHCFINIDKHSKKLYITDNNSKFGTLVFIQNKNIIMCQNLKLFIQIGRTCLEMLLSEAFKLFNCCGVGEKNSIDFYYSQNKEKNEFIGKLTYKTDYDMDYDKYKKVKKEDEKMKSHNENMITIDVEEENNSKKEDEIIINDEKDNHDDDIAKLIKKDQNSIIDKNEGMKE